MDQSYRDLIETSRSSSADDASVGSYMEAVQNDRTSLHKELSEVKAELQRQFTKLRKAKVQSDYRLREDIDAGLQQIDEARRQVKRALQELEGVR